MEPDEALNFIRTLANAPEVMTDAQRKMLLRSIIVVAQKGLGVAPDGVTECAPNVLAFPAPKST